MEEHDQYESVRLDDSLEDERNLDEIIADRRAAEAELDARDIRTRAAADRKLPQMLDDLVRHIESIIRMSEAHARMHLQSYVSQEDVDMAIRVLLDSFISTQKFGIQKALQKNFRKYMTFKKDCTELLLLLLHTLVKDALHFEEIVSGSTAHLTHVEVKVEDLKNKAQE
ncbi:unnamed protein product [Miscanthus lutarioriparius]|uniref:DNA helicase n=1 Tax=Miscanthus lutarioriparius TaxID=422564 RepID=A0A811RQF7_9POAL|nr:unnamed protein product [Miscanthus lutarioriparius]